MGAVVVGVLVARTGTGTSARIHAYLSATAIISTSATTSTTAAADSSTTTTTETTTTRTSATSTTTTTMTGTTTTRTTNTLLSHNHLVTCILFTDTSRHFHQGQHCGHYHCRQRHPQQAKRMSRGIVRQHDRASTIQLPTFKKTPIQSHCHTVQVMRSPSRWSALQVKP